MKKKVLLIVLFGLLILLLGKRWMPVNIETLPQKVIEKCMKEEDKFSCYDKEIPKLLKNMSMEEVFGVAREVQSKDPAYLYCHVLGHNIAAAETKKDPDNWKEVIARCPAGVCSNGCVHGAFQEKFRQETINAENLAEIKSELEGICEARENFNPSPLEQASCYHALGHLFMYITAGEITQSTELCNELTLKEDGRDYRPVCYDGAFMQIFQPLEREDEALVYGKVPEKDKVKEYCSSFDGEARYSCWSESWPMTLGNSPSGQEVISFCSELDTYGQESCYMDAFYILPISFNFDFGLMNDFCSNFPLSTKRGFCYRTFVQRIIEIDYRNKELSVDFCLSAPDNSLKSSCFDGLADNARFVFGDGNPEIEELCSYFPEEFKDACQL